MNEATLRGLKAPVRMEAAGLTDEANTTASAVSWAAIVAGAVGAAALSLILLLLGTGLGLSSVSPWAGQGASASTFGISTILWVSFTQLAAAGMGGYLAGRLRTRWAATHTDEVYFRDTAHGFLAWAVATLLTAAVLTSAVGQGRGPGWRDGGRRRGNRWRGDRRWRRRGIRRRHLAGSCWLFHRLPVPSQGGRPRGRASG